MASTKPRPKPNREPSKIVKEEINKLKLTKKDDIEEALRKCWNSIEESRCKSLVESMPKRIDDVLANKGGWTKY